MRYLFLTLLCLSVITFSCKKNTHDHSFPEGRYSGTFQRQSSAHTPTANVTINFSNNKWSGTSNMEKYPALCEGSYKTNGYSSITFEAPCPWTANFDWTLILSDEYKLNVQNNKLEITREYSNGNKDVYKLTKE